MCMTLFSISFTHKCFFFTIIESSFSVSFLSRAQSKISHLKVILIFVNVIFTGSKVLCYCLLNKTQMNGHTHVSFKVKKQKQKKQKTKPKHLLKLLLIFEAHAFLLLLLEGKESQSLSRETDISLLR